MKTFRKADTLYDLTTLSSPVLSASETQLFYVKSVIDQEKDAYRSSIWTIDLLTGEETPIADDAHNNFYPAVQSTYLLYLSDASGIPQVHWKDLKSQEEKQLTFSPHPVTHVQWIPDSNDFLFTTHLAKTTAKAFNWKTVSSESTVPRAPFYRMDQLNYQADGKDFVNMEIEHYLCEQHLHGEDVQIISTQETGYGVRRVSDSSADGSHIYFEKRLAAGDPYNHDSGIFVYDRHSRTMRHVTHSYDTGIFSEGSVSPDGRHIAMIGNPLPYHTRNQFHLFLYDSDKDSMTHVSEGKDIQFADNSVSDFFQHVHRPLIQWHPDSQSFFIQASEFGNVTLYRVTLEGEWIALSPGSSVVKEYVVSEQGNVYAFVSRPHLPLQLMVLTDGQWTSVSSPVERMYDAYAYADYREVRYTAKDGGMIHGFMVLPPKFNESQRYPLILNIHGGPYTMHAMNFYHEAQYMAANGYIVLLINPRGSFGYGQQHTFGVKERYGKEDYSDLMTAVDGVVNNYPFVDKEQLFVTGGSYGGFMTNWIITQTHQFKAAVAQRSMSNFVSMFGTSDIGYFFYKEETGLDLSEADKLWAMSPLAHVDKVETPLLLIHALEDLRCPFEQAQQFYIGLKYLGKTTEMLVFPDSSHELSRSGRPSYRVERLESILEWFERYRD